MSGLNSMYDTVKEHWDYLAAGVDYLRHNLDNSTRAPGFEIGNKMNQLYENLLEKGRKVNEYNPLFNIYGYIQNNATKAGNSIIDKLTPSKLEYQLMRQP